MTTNTTKNWSDEAVDQLMNIVGSQSPVSVESVERAAEQLGKTTRSIASKLRQLDREVAKAYYEMHNIPIPVAASLSILSILLPPFFFILSRSPKCFVFIS